MAMEVFCLGHEDGKMKQVQPPTSRKSQLRCERAYHVDWNETADVWDIWTRRGGSRATLAMKRKPRIWPSGRPIAITVPAMMSSPACRRTMGGTAWPGRQIAPKWHS